MNNLSYKEQLAVGIKAVREYLGLSIYRVEKEGVSHARLYSIEKGGNYSLTSFFEYIGVLNKYASCAVLVESDISAKLCNNIGEFGNILKTLRKEKNISLLSMGQISGLQKNKIIAIEQGRGYRVDTFVKYLKAFPSLLFDVVVR